ncbi:hypothetical protein [Propionivibrio limicola]|uniref:hypothetical protein n=1 Tax=Propionivibrio limicola TaxID=167645 RepID=UPI001290A19A|nr:hypothetical protein [Propionivibrio limicola]
MLEYLWTGPDVSGAGVTVIELGVFQARLGEISASVNNCLSFLEQADFVVCDKTTSEVFVLDWFRFHKFNSAVGQAAYAKGLRMIHSKKIRVIIEERFRLAGYKTECPVYNLTKIQKKQRGKSPTPTPTLTPTPTTTCTAGGGVFGIFYESAGRPDCLVARAKDLGKVLAAAGEEQARWAGAAWRATVGAGAAKDAEALAVALCKHAAEGRMSRPAAIAAAEKMEAARKVRAGADRRYAEALAVPPPGFVAGGDEAGKSLVGRFLSTPAGAGPISVAGAIIGKKIVPLSVIADEIRAGKMRLIDP